MAEVIDTPPIGSLDSPEPAYPHKNVHEALWGFQKEATALNLKPEGAGQVGGRRDYKYLTLDQLINEVRPLLVRHGLVWTTRPGIHEATGNPVLEYELTLAFPGQSQPGVLASWEIRGVMPLVMSKQDSQAQGSAITYARRYALCAVLNLFPGADDDGAAASEPEAEKAKPKRQRSGSSTAPADADPLLTDDQVGKALLVLAEYGMSDGEITDALGRIAGTDHLGALTLSGWRSFKAEVDRERGA